MTMLITTIPLLGFATISLLCASAPPNDYFTNRIVFPSTNFIFTTGSNIGATIENIESNKVSIPSGSSVWWEWRAPYSGRFLFCTEDSDFDTVLVLYIQGTGGNLLKLKEDDNGVSPDYVISTGSLISYSAISNVTYYIAVYGKKNGNAVAHGNIVLRIMPDNNMFSDAIQLTGERVQTIGFNGQADTETGETVTIGYSYTGKTIWWKWTPPKNGEYLISTIGSTFNTILGVYSNITKVPSSATTIRDDDSGSPIDLTSLVSFYAQTNTTYFIVVDGFQEEEINWSGKVILNIQPSNDRYTNRFRLYGTNTTDVSANGKATVEANELGYITSVVTPAQSPNAKSVWWEWQSPGGSGALVVDTMGSDFDTLLAIYRGESNFFGSGSDIKLITWDDNSGPPEANFTDICSLGVVPNRIYKIQVMGNGADGYGKVVVNLNFYPGPPNDMFTNRIILPSTNSITVTGSNVNASSEDNEPIHVGLNNGKSVWWSWTAPQTGITQISTYGSDFDTLLAVYTGNSITSLTIVATNNDDPISGGMTSAVSFQAIKGTTYHIAVDGLKYGDTYDSIDSGNIVLSLSQVVSPDNDLFTNRFALSGDLIRITASNQNATKENGEPAHAGDPGGSSVWWSWRPPFSGWATISTEQSSFDTLLAIYTGSSVTNLTTIAFNNDVDPAGGDFTSAVTLYVSSNITYQIAVDGFQGDSGTIKLSITLTTPSKFLTSGYNQNGFFSFKSSVLPGHTYEIQVSYDLSLWFSITNITATNSVLEFFDTGAQNDDKRFYRIVEYPY
ncbi:MAG: hypothetical protein ACP5MG_02580 [Verrucomicrobiia bacterium]